MDWNIPKSASLTSKLLSSTFSFKHQSPCIGTSFPKKFRKSSEAWTWNKTDCWNNALCFFWEVHPNSTQGFPSKKKPPSLRVFCDLTATVIPPPLSPRRTDSGSSAKKCSVEKGRKRWTFRMPTFFDRPSSDQRVVDLALPKDHWTLKTGYFEDPTPAIQVQTLPLEGPRSLGL